MIAEASRRRIRVFLSSPGDVVAHRVRAGQIVLKLAREFSYHFDVEPVLWERQPLRATSHFQDEIIPPRQTDITVVVLWGKLGTALPEDQFSGAVSGKKPVTGTEWEFEDAFAGYQARQRPHLLVYRCLDRIPVDLNDEDAVVRGQAGKRQVEEFMRRWFLNDSDQTLKAAFHPFTTLTEFEEKLESNLRDLLRQEAGNALGEVTGIRWHESPYRGLGVFDVQHAPIFFGRTRARNELLQCLSQRITAGTACVLVLGASGSGKSSLVRAGLIPDLLAGEVIPQLGLCRYALLKPSDATNPVAALAESLFRLHALPELAGLSYTASSLAELLEQAPAQAVLPIRQGLEQAARNEALAGHAIARLVIVVDQLEELFTLDTIGAQQREQFARVLEALARSGLVWVIATLRSDFFDRLETLPQLAQLTDGGRYLVLPPDSAELGQIIRQPAREGGVRFERSEQAGVSLDDRILVQAQKSPGALPLLEFLLDELWKQRTDAGLLTFAAFDELGGLEGAIGRRAEEEFQLLPVDVQQAFPEMLRELVTVGDEGIATSRPAAMSRFIPGTAQREAVDAFLRPETRLLVAHSDDQSRPQVRLTHEALLTHWERARSQIEQDKADLQARARLELAAHRWRAKEQDEDLLLPPGIQLTEAMDLLQRREQMLDAPTQAYIAASSQAEAKRQLARAQRERQEVEEKAQMQRQLHEEEQNRLIEQAMSARRIKRRTQVAASILLVMLCISSILGLSAYRDQRALVRADALRLWREGWALQRQGDSTAALRRLVSSARMLPREGVRQGLLNMLAYGGLQVPVIPPLHHEGQIHGIRFSPDGRTLLTVTLDGSVRLWDRENGEPIGKMMRHDSQVMDVVFSPDGKRFATGSEDGKARLWNAESGEPLGLPIEHEGMVFVPGFRSDGSLLVTATPLDSSVHVWDSRTGLRVGRPFQLEFQDADISPDGTKIVTASGDGTVRLWNTFSGEPLGQVMVHKEQVNVVEFSPDGALIASASDDKTAQLWEVASGSAHGPMMVHHDKVHEMRFSPDGRKLVTTSRDHTARIWDVDTARPLTNVMLHDEEVSRFSFSSDGASLTTATPRSIRTWDAQTGRPIGHTLQLESFTDTQALSDDGRHAATGAGGTVNVWDVGLDPPRPRTMEIEAPIKQLDLIAEGTRLVLGTEKEFRVLSYPDLRMVTKPDVNPARTYMGFVEHDDPTRFATLHVDGVFGVDPVILSLWDSISGTQLGRALSFNFGLFDIALNGDGSRLILSDSDRLQVMDHLTESADKALIRRDAVVGRGSADLSTDGSLAAAADGRTARIWEAQGGWVNSKELLHAEAVTRVLFHPKQSVLLTLSKDKTAQLWSAQSGRVIGEKMAHEQEVTNATFSKDGMRLLTETDAGLRLWDGVSGEALGSSMTHDGRRFVAMSHDSGRVASTSTTSTRLWDGTSGTPIGTPIEYLRHSDEPFFSDDGSILVTSGSDVGGPSDPHAVRLWSAFTGEQIGPDIVHTTEPIAVITPDRKALITGGEDRVLRISTLPSSEAAEDERVLALAEAIAGFESREQGAQQGSTQDAGHRLDRERRRARTIRLDEKSPDIDRIQVWLFSPPETRTVNPWSDVKMSDCQNNGCPDYAEPTVVTAPVANLGP